MDNVMGKYRKTCELQRQEAVKTLAERHGITKVDEEYEDGETLLSRAAACESCLDLLQLLIAAGADVNHADADGCTPLYRACTAFNTDGARLLVEGGADVNAATREGETPLMNAALGNHAEMVKILLQAGANVNAVDAQGCTALDAAEAACSRECMRLLQRAGGRTGRKDPLFQAVANGDTAAVKELVATHQYSQAKLQRAASNACIADNAGMLKLLSPLLSHSKPGDGRFWAYLVRMAAWKDSRACLEYLLGDLGFSPDGDEGRMDAPAPECWFEVDDESEGMTPLTCAASAGHAECVRLLLHYGAAPDLEDEIDETPLEAAEETGRKECAKLIREAMG